MHPLSSKLMHPLSSNFLMLVCVHNLMQNSKGELQSRLVPRQQGSAAEPSQALFTETRHPTTRDLPPLLSPSPRVCLYDHTPERQTPSYFVRKPQMCVCFLLSVQHLADLAPACFKYICHKAQRKAAQQRTPKSTEGPRNASERPANALQHVRYF